MAFKNLKPKADFILSPNDYREGTGAINIGRDKTLKAATPGELTVFPTSVATPYGLGWSMPNNSGQALEIEYPAFNRAVETFTAITTGGWFYSTNAAVDNAICGQDSGQAGSSAWRVELDQTSGTELSPRMYSWDEADAATFTDPSIDIAGRWVHLIFVFYLNAGNSVEHEVWLDGKLAATGTASGTGWNTGDINSTPFAVAARGGGAHSQPFPGIISGLFVDRTRWYAERIGRAYANHQSELFEPRMFFVPLVAEEQIAPGIVAGSISFDITIDKQPSITLTAETAATFLINLAMGQTAPTLGNISFDITADKAISNTADRPVNFTASIDLDQLQSNTATLVKNALFNISLDQTQTNVKTTGNIITFSTNLDFEILKQLITSASKSFDIDLTFDILNQLVTSESVYFDIDLTFDILNQLIANKNVDFDTDLTFDILNQLVTSESVSFDTDLAFNILNQLVANKNVDFDIDLTFDILNQLVANKNVDFDIDLTFDILKTLSANVNISLNTDLTMAQSGSTAGIINGAITFALTANQVQTNRLTANKAFELIMNMSDIYSVQLDKIALLTLLIQVSDEYQAQRGVPGVIDFDVILDKTDTNIATRVASLTFAAALDQAITTQVNYNPFVTLATTLAFNILTGGDVLASISFDIDVDKKVIRTKTVNEAITLALQTDQQANIHLIATGNISFVSEMEVIQAKQLIGQSEITFGHLLGLASIGNADLNEEITFSTIQNMQVDGFLIQFELITPKGRKFKVYLEDRTTSIDEENRAIIINKQGDIIA